MRHETFRHLSVELPESSGADGSAGDGRAAPLLSTGFSPETLERSARGDGCDGASATLVRRIVRLPRVLVVHLKRFRYVRTTGGTKAAARDCGEDDENARDGDGNAPTRAEPAPAPAPFAMRMVKATRPVEASHGAHPRTVRRGGRLGPARSPAPVEPSSPPRSFAPSDPRPPTASSSRRRGSIENGSRGFGRERRQDVDDARGALAPEPEPGSARGRLQGCAGVVEPGPRANDLGAVDGGRSARDLRRSRVARATRPPRRFVYPDDASPSGADAKRQAANAELRGSSRTSGRAGVWSLRRARSRTEAGRRRRWTTFDDEAVDEVEEGRVLRDRTGCYVAVYVGD